MKKKKKHSSSKLFAQQILFNSATLSEPTLISRLQRERKQAEHLIHNKQQSKQRNFKFNQFIFIQELLINQESNYNKNQSFPFSINQKIIPPIAYTGKGLIGKIKEIKNFKSHKI